MGPRTIAVLVGIGLCMPCITGVALSQERVEVEKLYLHDPTVSDNGQWIFGISGEAWMIWMPGTFTASALGGGSTSRIATRPTSGVIYGGTIYAGKDNWSFFLSGRQGKTDTGMRDDLPAGSMDWTFVDHRYELDGRARWLLPGLFGWKGVVPYLIGGVIYAHSDFDYNIHTPGFVWTETGTRTGSEEAFSIAPYIGPGLLFTFADWIGLRVDAVFGGGYAERTYLSSNNVAASAFYTAGHATLYVNITDNINLQIGGKGQLFDTNVVGTAAYYGGFAMVGVNF
jgi:hypothetical protein